MMVKAEDCQVVLVELKESDEALMMEEEDKVRSCEHKKVTSSIERETANNGKVGLAGLQSM